MTSKQAPTENIVSPSVRPSICPSVRLSVSPSVIRFKILKVRPQSKKKRSNSERHGGATEYCCCVSKQPQTSLPVAPTSLAVAFPFSPFSIN